MRIVQAIQFIQKRPRLLSFVCHVFMCSGSAHFVVCPILILAKILSYDLSKTLESLPALTAIKLEHKNVQQSLIVRFLVCCVACDMSRRDSDDEQKQTLRHKLD